VPLDRSPKGSTKETLAAYRPLSARGTALTLPTADPRKVPVEVVVEALGPIDVPVGADGAGTLDLELRIVARAAGEIVDRYERTLQAKVRPGGIEALRKALRAEGRLVLVPGL
jgi:hypothetical protein